MTARPDAPELSAAERDFLDRPDEPESLRFRVAQSMRDMDGTGRYRIGYWLNMADAALAVVRGETQ